MVTYDVAYLVAACPTLPPSIVVFIVRLVTKDEISFIRYIIMCTSRLAFTQLNDIFYGRVADLRHFLIRHISAIRHEPNYFFWIKRENQRLKVVIDA